MNASTIKLHQTLLRLAKGMVKAYGDWLEEETVTAMADELKKVRRQQQREPRVSKVDMSSGNE